MLKKLLVPLFVLILSGCKTEIHLNGFNDKIWRGDKGGCLGERKQTIDSLLISKNKLKGHTTEDIVDFLGNPDKKELASRNQKTFYYFIEPGIHCNLSSSPSPSKAPYIYIRFSALNKATEIVFERN